MFLSELKIIAPDSSHWAKWLDAASSNDSSRRHSARTLHERLMERSRLPLLSWHHLEELLGGEDDDAARARIAFLQELPMLAYLRLPKGAVGFGSIAQVLAAEAIAAAEGHDNLISIRDRARELLLKIGSGKEAIGKEAWVWEALRPLIHARKSATDLTAALSPFRPFDESQTIGELANKNVNSPEKAQTQMMRLHAQVLEQAKQSIGGDATRALAMARDFMAEVLAGMPPPGTTVREILTMALVSQGLDEDEIRDECVLGDLNRLALFRSQLRAAVSDTDFSFDALKKIPMEMLPSRVIVEALRTHGQPRTLRPGSDLNDGYLGALAAYCAVLYVDKRTAEDFRRAISKEPRLKGLVGEIAKAADFEELLGPEPS